MIVLIESEFILSEITGNRVNFRQKTRVYGANAIKQSTLKVAIVEIEISANLENLL